MKKRVAYIGHVAQMSGGEIALLRLLPHLDEVDAHVILAEEGPLVARLRDAGVTVEVLPLAASVQAFRKDAVRPGTVPLKTVLATAAYTLRLARRLRQLDPDLVHTNTLKAGVYGSIAARLARKPVIWHVRDRISPDYLPRGAVTVLRGLIRVLPTSVIANSTSTLMTLRPWRRMGPHYAIAHSVVPEVAVAAPSTTRSDSSAFRIGIVGRLAPWKGQDLFLEAFARAFPSAEGNERAAIIGAAMFGEDDYAAGLQALAERLGIADRTEFRGFREDVWPELGRLDVVVNASRSPEPFGQVVLEAMVAGLPVVVPDTGGPAEIVDHGRSGLHFRANDPEDLARALRRLRDDADLRARLGVAGREASETYSPQRVAAQVQRLYDDILVLGRSGKL